MPQGFTHLHLHSSYSLLDGAVRIKELIPTAKEMGFESLALTDHGNMFGAIDFYRQARNAGIKPIIGCESYVAPGARTDKTKRGAYHLILLARSNEGYANLIKLVSKANLEGFYYRPRIDRELLGAHSAGLIGMSACLGGEIPRAFREGGLERSKRVAASIATCSRRQLLLGGPEQRLSRADSALNDALRRIGKELGVGLVAQRRALPEGVRRRRPRDPDVHPDRPQPRRPQAQQDALRQPVSALGRSDDGRAPRVRGRRGAHTGHRRALRYRHRPGFDISPRLRAPRGPHARELPPEDFEAGARAAPRECRAGGVRREGLLGAPREGAWGHYQDGVPRLLLHRLGLHPSRRSGGSR